MELSDERLCRWNFIHSFTSSEWDGTAKLKLYSLMNFREHLSTTKTRHLSVSEDTDGAEFYCDENSTLNHQCSHSRFLRSIYTFWRHDHQHLTPGKVYRMCPQICQILFQSVQNLHTNVKLKCTLKPQFN